MRKLLLLLGFFTLTLSTTYAQCTPSPIFVNIGIPGFWPNPALGALPDGEINVPYNQTVTVIVVQDTTLDLSAIIGFPVPPVQVSVNYQSVTNVNGLPTGMSYVCDTSSCAWLGGDAGCFKLTGTPTQSGNFTVGIETSLNVDVPASVPVIGGTAIDVPIPAISYDLFIDNPNFVDGIEENTFSVGQNSPNPFSGITEIMYNAPTPMDISLDIVNMNGAKVFSETQRAASGNNTISVDGSNWAPGVYFYSLSNGEERITKKFVVMK